MLVFWDTNLFIYLWENSTATARVQRLRAWQRSEKAEVATSTLTVGEILVHPLRQGRADIANTYRDIFRQLRVIPYDLDAALLFAQLRADHPTLKPPDAIQLACAAAAGVDLFVTNDRRLSRFKPPAIGKIQSLSDFA
ncbi:MAG TPA: PIN domain-containing protein [Chthoniobacterales bacterium]|jgi:predicted nucleic acid-binding protein|nr:PIN domain-containing protein [Chthoniobacterales bacterium]